ncbi:MAG: response regulator, partial [Nitrospinota bacterium]
MHKNDIVIVDNSVSTNKSLSNQLQKAGFSKIHTFSDSREALEELLSIGPGLILAEVNMEGVDGWQLCKILRSETYKPFNHVPIILYSTTTQNPDAYQLASSVGASAFIQPPFKYEDIITLVYTHYISPNAKSLPFKAGHTKKIVIADDDSNILKILKFCLDENGYTVETASNGKEAIEAIEKLRPQVVLLDYQMPVMDGMDVLKWLKREFPNIGVVVLTAHGSEKTAIHFMKEGADDYIRKPFDIKELPSICELAYKKYSIRQNNMRFKEQVMELKESEAKYRGIVDNSSDMIYTLDENGNFRFINRQGELLLKYTLSEISGKPFEQVMYKDDIERAGRQFFERRTGARAWKRFEVRLVSKEND